MSIERLKNISEEVTARRKEIEKEIKELVKSVSDEVFARFDEVHAIAWNQWIPGFNDGDPCYFTMGEVLFLKDPGEDELVIEECGEHDITVSDWDSENKAYIPRECSQEAFDCYREVSSAFQALDTFMEGLFGSNAQVVITRDGVNVEEYWCGY